MNIELDENGHLFVSTKFGHVTKTKLVDAEEFISKLSNGVRKSDGLLPRGIRIREEKGSRVLVGLEFPSRKWSSWVRLYNSQESEKTNVNPIMPAGVIFVLLNKSSNGCYSFNNSWIFARDKDSIAMKEERLYSMPTPNIYKHEPTRSRSIESNHNICWGAVGIPEFIHLSAVAGLVNSFFGQGFNGDLYEPKHLVSSNAENKLTARGVVDYFEQLSEKDEFDKRWLVETPFTVQSFIDSVRL